MKENLREVLDQLIHEALPTTVIQFGKRVCAVRRTVHWSNLSCRYRITAVAITSVTLALADCTACQSTKDPYLSVMSAICLLLRHILCTALHKSVFLFQFAQTLPYHC